MGNSYNPSGGAGLTTEQEDVLKRLSYNTNKDQLVAKSSISVPLNSLYVGEQHKLSSGGDDIFLSNITKNIDYFFGVGGIKDQYVPANQDETGIIPVYERIYSSPVDTVIDYVEKVPHEYAPYLFPSYVIARNRTSFGISVRVGQALDVDTVIRFSIDRGGTTIYMQDVKIETALGVGDMYIYKYTQPIEYTKGDVLDIALGYSTDGKETWLPVDVSVGVNAGEVYDVVLRRNYIDIPVHKNGRAITSASTGDDLVIKPFDNLLIGALTSNVALTLHNSTESFTIRDLDENINGNSVTVTLDASNSITLDRKNDYVIVNKVNNTWYYYNFRNGKGEVI